MQVNIDIYAIIIFLGVVQGLFLFYVFVRHNHVNKANIYFAFFILTFSLICLEILLNYTGLTADYLFLVDFSEPLNFFIAPLFYMYLCRNYFDLEPNKRLHFSYPLFYFFYSFLFWLQPESFKKFAYLSAYDPINSNIVYEKIFPHDPLTLKANVMEVMILQLVIYFVLVLLLFKNHELVTKTISRRAFFKKILFISAFLIIAIVFVRNYFDGDLGDHFLAVCSSTLIYYLSYLVYSNSTALSRNFGEKKYSSSKLSEAKKNEYRKRITAKLENDKVYLDSKLNVSRFSKIVLIPSKHVSQVINECFNMNFNELVNSYRIKEAQRKILDPEYNNIKIEGLGYECGFNSKSAFFTAFKKYTKMTPLDYRNMKQQQT